MKIRIATRESQLALWQANFIKSRLEEVHAGLEIELVGMTTKGDRWLSAPLSEIGGKGLFIKELEAAMLAGEADLAVHSMKDVPADLPARFTLPLIAFRDDVADVLVSPAGPLDRLPQGARVGSSSLRRQAQLLAHRPDLEMMPIRGNVNTRLAKLDAGEFDAIVLAAAGLNRLKFGRKDVHALDQDICLPAPGQGALGIECLEDSPAIELLTPLMDAQCAKCVTAERGISLGLGADCSLPVAAHATIGTDGTILLRARLASASGDRILRTEGQGTDPDAVARDAVEDLMHQGAAEILRELHG